MVEWATSTRPAISLGPHPVRLRSVMIRRSIAGSMRVGVRVGRLDRSCRHTSELRSLALAARHLLVHSQAVDFAIPA
jgi:hypothetical protein